MPALTLTRGKVFSVTKMTPAVRRFREPVTALNWLVDAEMWGLETNQAKTKVICIKNFTF